MIVVMSGGSPGPPAPTVTMTATTIATRVQYGVCDGLRRTVSAYANFIVDFT